MSTECPSQAWDRYSEGQDATADAAMALEEEVLEEVRYSNPPPSDDLEGFTSDVIQAAYRKGYTQAVQDRKDGQITYEAEQEQQRIGKKYVVIPYLGIHEGDYEPMSYEDALKEQEHFEIMQPENVYKIEEVEEAESLPNDPADW